MGLVIKSDFLPLRKSFHTNSLEGLLHRDVFPATAGQMSCRRKQWFSPGVNKRTKVGEWMIKIWLHKAINTSVIAVFFWNKPRFCPVLLRLCHSFLIPAHPLAAPLLPQCHRCHLPMSPPEFSRAGTRPGLISPDELIPWQVSRWLLTF